MNKTFSFVARWLSESGDTTMWSWVITIMYFLVIIVSLFYTKKIKKEKEKHFLWVCISIFVFAMGLNKQLDIQILLTMIGKNIAWNYGLMDSSRTIWRTLAMVILISVFVLGSFILYKARKILHKEIVSLAGVAILMFFTLIRVGSISHIALADRLQNGIISRIHGVELLGLVVILISLIIKIYDLHKSKKSESLKTPYK